MRIHTVVGNFCGTDTFAWDRPLNEVREGYLLAIHHAGAYGHSMTSNSNSRQRPPEVLVHAGKPVLIRRRDTLAGLLSDQVHVYVV